MIKKRNVRHNKRKKTITQLLLPIARALPFFAILAFIVWSVLKSNPTEFLKVDIQWNIDERLPINQTALANKIQPLIQDKYQLDLHQIKQALENESWVSKAHINRLFWNSIQIDVEAKLIAMRWKNINCKEKDIANCTGYISTDGELFTPKKSVVSNAVLAFSKQDQIIVSKLYADYKHYQELSNPMAIKSFSKTNIDQLTLEPNVKVILGYQKQDERLGRFIKAYNKLKKSNSRVKQATFDMRYPKGFALSY
jgi:cell division protein FtsQ